MLEIRRCEEQLARLHQTGFIPGACHTYVGEEAIATAVCAHLRESDTVMSTHRGHGHALAKGVPPRELIAELLGKVTGCSHGRGGSMHLFKPEVGMLGTSGIVGPSILMAAGAGYTYMLKKSDQVAVAFFGDGAVSNGAFHEGLNLATVWDLPVLFVCENNQYATEVPFATITKNTERRVEGGGVRLAGYRAGWQRCARHLSGGGRGDQPRALRRRADPARMQDLSHARRTPRGCATWATARRTRSSEWRGRDPIARLRERLLGGRYRQRRRDRPDRRATCRT